MGSIDETRARQLRQEILRLHQESARELDKACKASEAAANAREQAIGTKSDTTRRSKMTEAQRKERDALAAQKRQAGVQRRIADKTRELNQREQRIAADQAKDTKALQDELRRRQQTDRRAVTEQLRAMRSDAAASVPPATGFDLFVSHASPDKEEVVRPLAEALKERGARVFYDEWEIRLGDSIRKRIDDGLSRSRYGVVILSRSFLAGRTWTDRELSGLFALEEDDEPRILPIWHDVSKSQVAAYSPVLADRAALKTADYTIEEIADFLIRRLGI